MTIVFNKTKEEEDQKGIEYGREIVMSNEIAVMGQNNMKLERRWTKLKFSWRRGLSQMTSTNYRG